MADYRCTVCDQNNQGAPHELRSPPDLRDMSGHVAGQPLECFVNQVVLQKQPLLDERGNHQLDEAGKPRYLCGFCIAGGIDQDNSRSPQGYPDKGIYVTHINEGGAAERAGLRVHDKILQVNGHDMTMATHKKAVDYITRKPILEMFIYRPKEGKQGGARRGNLDVRGGRGVPGDDLSGLGKEMNKMNMRCNNQDGQFGNFDGNLNCQGTGPRFNSDEKHRFQGQGPISPQPLPRIHGASEPQSQAGSRIDAGRGAYEKQFEGDQYRNRSDYAAGPQQRYPQYPQGEAQSRNWESSKTLDNFQHEGGPLKPPRWQQYAPTDQQRLQHQQRPPQSNAPSYYAPQDRAHHSQRVTQNQNSAFDNQTGRSNQPSDYRMDSNQALRPSYSSSAHQAQRSRQVADRNQSIRQPAFYFQQQRPYGVNQQIPGGYVPEKRSTLPYNPNVPSQNNFY